MYVCLSRFFKASIYSPILATCHTHLVLLDLITNYEVLQVEVLSIAILIPFDSKYSP